MKCEKRKDKLVIEKDGMYMGLTEKDFWDLKQLLEDVQFNYRHYWPVQEEANETTTLDRES